MSARSIVTPTRNFYKPKPDPMDQLCQDLEMLGQHMRNRVDGGHLVPPTTASTQASGAGGNTNWRVNIQTQVAIVDGDNQHISEQIDYAIWVGTPLLQINEECVAVIVAKNVSGAVSLDVQIGAVAGSAVSPTDSEIQTKVGANNEWIRLGETKLRRTADTTVFQTYNNQVRPLLGVNVDAAFGDWTFIDTYLTEKMKSV
jgi:hypothetical protein